MRRARKYRTLPAVITLTNRENGMKKIIWTYGLLSGAVIIGIIIISMAVWGMEGASEWLGYLVMVAALSLIFFGIKTYRDREQGGVISFWTGCKMGFGISLVASIVYVGAWELYLATSDVDFMEQYSTSYIEQLQAEGATEQEVAEARALMDSYRAMYANPLTRMGITFLEIFPVGVLITLISAVLLRKSSFLPAGSAAR